MIHFMLGSNEFDENLRNFKRQLTVCDRGFCLKGNRYFERV